MMKMGAADDTLEQIGAKSLKMAGPGTEGGCNALQHTNEITEFLFREFAIPIDIRGAEVILQHGIHAVLGQLKAKLSHEFFEKIACFLHRYCAATIGIIVTEEFNG